MKIYQRYVIPHAVRKPYIKSNQWPRQIMPLHPKVIRIVSIKRGIPSKSRPMGHGWPWPPTLPEGKSAILTSWRCQKQNHLPVISGTPPQSNSYFPQPPPTPRRAARPERATHLSAATSPLLLHSLHSPTRLLPLPLHCPQQPPRPLRLLEQLGSIPLRMVAP